MGRITLDKVRKAFGEVEVIPPLDLTIEDGEFVVFVGPSGCGKSTLLRLIAGLEDVTGGEIRIDGQDATMVPPAGAALRWCSSPTRSTRTCRCARTSPSRCGWQDGRRRTETRVAAAPMS
jgi:ABC-type cobalamin/Fe3+-siderophores transport system ATPase subunit